MQREPAGQPRQWTSRGSRTWNIRKWDDSNRVLVVGEVIAVLAAVAAFVFDFPGRDAGKWCIYIAAVIAAGALAWYAVDRTTQGDMPLTGISARRIARVAQMASMEQEGTLEIDWDTISADGVTANASFLEAPLEFKRMLLSAALDQRRSTHAPQLTPDQFSAIIGAMPEEELNKLMADVGLASLPLSFGDFTEDDDGGAH